MNAPKTATSSTHRVDEGVPHGRSTPGSRRSTMRTKRPQDRARSSTLPRPLKLEKLDDENEAPQIQCRYRRAMRDTN